MARWRIEFDENYRSSPVSFWVHRHQDNDIWAEATRFEPPLPQAIVSKGYPRLIIDAFGTKLEFSSIEEVEHCRQVLSQKNLPTSRKLASLRQSSLGPNSHWLSRLPADLKPWRKREKLLPLLDAGLDALKVFYERS